VVTLSSVAGFLPTVGRPAYVGAKHAVTGVFRALGAELAPDGIAVTVVHPAFLATPVTEVGAAAARSTTGAPIDADDVARAVVAVARPPAPDRPRARPGAGGADGYLADALARALPDTAVRLAARSLRRRPWPGPGAIVPRRARPGDRARCDRERDVGETTGPGLDEARRRTLAALADTFAAPADPPAAEAHDPHGFWSRRAPTSGSSSRSPPARGAPAPGGARRARQAARRAAGHRVRAAAPARTGGGAAAAVVDVRRGPGRDRRAARARAAAVLRPRPGRRRPQPELGRARLPRDRPTSTPRRGR
jgi:hypothetical protein